MAVPECASRGNKEGCESPSPSPAVMSMDSSSSAVVAEADWLEQPLVGGFRIWHIMFLCFASLLGLVVLLCCCFRFRIPRTKQEIEADYVRKKITRKFQKQLKAIANTDMDDMDLKRALDRVREDLKSDSETPPMSEASVSSEGQHPAQETKKLATCADQLGAHGEVRHLDVKHEEIAEMCCSK